MPIVAGNARPGGASHFRYAEFPGWNAATREQLDHLDAMVADQVEPARVALGVPIVATSWLRAADASSSIHPKGAALDLVAGAPLSRDATWSLFTWLARHAQFGELIYEQPNTGSTGHVHLTRPGFGGTQQVLYQRSDGRLLELDPFSLAASRDVGSRRPEGAGTADDPIRLPGIDVVVSRYGWLLPWAAVGLAVWFVLEGEPRRPRRRLA